MSKSFHEKNRPVPPKVKTQEEKFQDMAKNYADQAESCVKELNRLVLLLERHRAAYSLETDPIIKAEIVRLMGIRSEDIESMKHQIKMLVAKTKAYAKFVEPTSIPQYTLKDFE